MLLLCTTSQVMGLTEDEYEALTKQVIAKADQISVELAKNPLTPDPAVLKAEIPPTPDHLRDAPPIFLDAWKEYSRFRTSLPLYR